VTVQDTTPPILTLPANQTVEATSAQGATDAGAFTAMATDLVTASPTIVYEVGTTPVTSTYEFPLGTTTVLVTATDQAGNASMGTFTVTVTTVTLLTAGEILSAPTYIPISTLPPLPAPVTPLLSVVTQFTVDNVAPGGGATVVIQLPAGTLEPNTAYAYFKYNLNYDPSNPSSVPWVRVNPGVATFNVAQQTITLNLKVDGLIADGDEDPANNGDILDPGLPVMLATPQVAVNPINISYGTALANSQLTGTASFVENGTTVSVPGAFTYTSAAGTVLGVGTNQMENVTFTPNDSIDFTSVQTTVAVNVAAQVTLKVKVQAVNITYGTALNNDQLTGTATTATSPAQSVPGTFTFTSAAGAVLGAGNGQTEAVTFTPSDSALYAPLQSTVTIDVAKAAPQVAVNPVNVTYHTALNNSQLSGTGSFIVNGQSVTVAGTFTYTSASAAGDVLAGGTHTESVTFTPTDTIDYKSVSTSVTVTVSPAMPTVTVNAVSLTYGTALKNSQLSGTATFIVNGQAVTVAGAFSYTSAVGTVLTAGETTESVTFTPTNTADYQAVTTSVMVGVSPASPKVTVDSVSLVYGTALVNSQLMGTATFVVNGQTVTVAGTFAYANAGSVLTAGQTTESVTFTPMDSVDYQAVSTSVTVKVSQATPTVTVNPVNLPYGTALNNTQLSGTASFIVNGQSVPVAGTFTYTSASAAGDVLAGGTHTESVTFTPTDAIDYKAVSISVTVTVAPVMPTVTVNAVNITYGTALKNSQLSGAATFVVNGQTVTVAGTFAYTSAVGTVLAAGETTESVTFTPTNTADYQAVSTTVTVNVAR
jgi:hypothetical protein